jgi:hypothetical protein
MLLSVGDVTVHAEIVITAAQLREIVLSLPEVEERETWGHPTFRVRDKIFGSLSEDDQSGGFKATVEHQRELVGADPGTYSVAAYTGRYGWVEVKLATADPDELRDIIVEAWRRTAPKRLVSAYDSAAG